MLPGEGVFESAGTEQILGGTLQKQAVENEMASGALKAWGGLQAAELEAEARKAAAASQSRGQTTGAIVGAVGSVGGAVAGALI